MNRLNDIKRSVKDIIHYLTYLRKEDVIINRLKKLNFKQLDIISWNEKENTVEVFIEAIITLKLD